MGIWAESIMNGNMSRINREFKQIFDNYSINTQKIQVTTCSPQTNAIIERVHKVVNDKLRSFDLENNHKTLEEQKVIHLATSFNQLHGFQAIRSNYHTTLQTISRISQLVFGRDVIHNIVFIAN
jgi:hypothetical protein